MTCWMYSLRACLILSAFALSRRGLARLRRANKLICCVEHARSACSTQHINLGERRRREQAIVMAIRQTLTLLTRRWLVCDPSHAPRFALARFIARPRSNRQRHPAFTSVRSPHSTQHYPYRPGTPVLSRG